MARQQGAIEYEIPVVLGRNGKARSPKMVRRSLEVYGPDLTNPLYAVFAELLSKEKSQYEAFLSCFPHAKKWKRSAVDSQASCLAAHPKVAEMMAGYTLGIQNVARAAALPMLKRMIELGHGMHGANPQVQAKAQDSVMDRGGLPRSTEISVTGRVLAVNMLARMDTMTLPPRAGELAGPSDVAERLEAARERARQLIPARSSSSVVVPAGKGTED